MPSPLTVAQFKPLSIMPGEDIDELETKRPNFLINRLHSRWSWITSRLRKRYDVAAMQVGPPEVALMWLATIVTRDAYDARGNNPSGFSDKEAIYEAALRAEAEVKEAADSHEGLYDLPLLAGNTTSGISAGGPLGYAETSPYRAGEIQRRDGRLEDETGV